MSALDTQEGGSHYKDKTIQPVEYIHANGLGFCEGNVVKYVTRWRDKNGLADLKKAKHYIDLLIELESRSQDRHPMTPNVISYPAKSAGVDVSFDGEERMLPIGQNGNTGEHYQRWRKCPECLSEHCACVAR